MKRIYLDYAATTPLDPTVAATMKKFERTDFANPNSVHREGQRARANIDTARALIAKFLSAKPQEIIFTSGATESNNLAIAGAVLDHVGSRGAKPHVVTTQLEHQSVFNVVKKLAERGVVEADFVAPTNDGLITAQDVLKKIKKNTALVSVIMVSNEIGTILPVREIGKEIEKLNKSRKRKILFHVDAAQALKFYNCHVGKIGCDLMTISAHKIYGPKGVGALFVRAGVKLESLIIGGSQEYGKRAGTQNTSGIIGFAVAIRMLGSLDERQKQKTRLAAMRDRLISGLLKIKNVSINGPLGENRSADNVNFTVFGVDQDALLVNLDLAGLACSTGSACVSGSSKPSHVIRALGKIGKKPAATVRITLGKGNKSSDVDYALNKINEIIKKISK
jgi:cysteine desulfurase